MSSGLFPSIVNCCLSDKQFDIVYIITSVCPPCGTRSFALYSFPCSKYGKFLNEYTTFSFWHVISCTFMPCLADLRAVHVLHSFSARCALVKLWRTTSAERVIIVLSTKQKREDILLWQTKYIFFAKVSISSLKKEYYCLLAYYFKVFVKEIFPSVSITSTCKRSALASAITAASCELINIGNFAELSGSL